jgi:hypothetical protein
MARMREKRGAYVENFGGETSWKRTTRKTEHGTSASR